MTLNSVNISIIKRLLGGKNNKSLKAILLKIQSPDIATLFPLFNDHENRHLLEALIAINKAHEVLIELPENQAQAALELLDLNKKYTILSHCSEDEAAFLIHLTPNDQEALMNMLPAAKKTRLLQLLNYPEGSAGRIMSTEVFTLPVALTAQEAIEKIRERSQESSIYYIYCVSDDQKLMGVISLRELVTAPAQTPLQSILKKEVVTVTTTTPEKKVAELVGHYDFIAIPVVDEEKSLKGIITVDDVVDLIQEQATADIYASAGLQEDDKVYSPVMFSVKNRAPWMILNLMLAIVSSSVIALFENTMSQLIVLASLNSIVAGIGGNTAIQTLTVVTRGLATGDFNFTTYMRAAMKEISVGAIIGLQNGVLAGFIVYMWKNNVLVGYVIGIAMLLNAIIASAMGAFIPILLKKWNWDPASGSGVIVTFVTDSFGFFAFLGIAHLALTYLT